jgi:starch synthase/alpha-amylase
LADILYRVISTFWEDRLQLVFVADGAYFEVFGDIIRFHGFEKRVALQPYDAALEHLGYGAADFVLMPSRFEPCGLPQMIGAIYGALPVARAVGGLRDTVHPLDPEANSGNGFLFEHYDAEGLFRAIGQAMAFYRSPARTKARQIRRIMDESAAAFSHEVMAREYIAFYQQILQQPVTGRSR